jgi:putative transposase
MRIHGSAKKMPVLVPIGVNEEGQQVVLGLRAGDKESPSSWQEFFKDLKRRGLDCSEVLLGIMGGLPSLERVFEDEFPTAEVQRCQIRVTRNVLATVPRKLKKVIADEVRSICYASSRKKALKFFDQFKTYRENELPSPVKCLEASLDSCLTYLKVREEEWICHRTTNVTERVNKEFKRKTKPIEILAGGISCYTLLAFVCLQMELKTHRKSGEQPAFPSKTGRKQFPTKSLTVPVAPRIRFP